MSRGVLESTMWAITLDDDGDTADMFTTRQEALAYRVDPRQKLLRVEFWDVTPDEGHV